MWWEAGFLQGTAGILWGQRVLWNISILGSNINYCLCRCVTLVPLAPNVLVQVREINAHPGLVGPFLRETTMGSHHSVGSVTGVMMFYSWRSCNSALSLSLKTHGMVWRVWTKKGFASSFKVTGYHPLCKLKLHNKVHLVVPQNSIIVSTCKQELQGPHQHIHSTGACYNPVTLRLQRLVVSMTEIVLLVELSRAAVYWIDMSLKGHHVRMSLLITYRYTTLNTRIEQTSMFISCGGCEWVERYQCSQQPMYMNLCSQAGPSQGGHIVA